MRSTIKRNGAILLTGTMLVLSTGRLQAQLAPATSPMSASLRMQDQQTVQTFLEQKEVAQHLAGMGLNSYEIQSRLGNLSDDELHDVATHIHQQQPGRDGGGLIVTVLLIGILALLFVYLLKRV